MMQRANVTVALGGDLGNTVPKTNVTAAEIAVLRSIHGEAAVFDIEPTGSIKSDHRAERARLMSIYGNAKDGNDNSIVAGLFPGAASRVFEKISELELPEEFFKIEKATRHKAKVDAEDEAEEAHDDEDADAANEEDEGEDEEAGAERVASETPVTRQPARGLKPAAAARKANSKNSNPSGKSSGTAKARTTVDPVTARINSSDEEGTLNDGVDEDGIESMPKPGVLD